MKIIFLVLTTIISLNLASCIKPDEFCYLIEECDESDQLMIKKKSCPKPKCHGSLKFKCGTQLCTKDRLSCQKLLMWSILIGQMRDPQSIETQMTNFQIFSTRIENCPFYEWKPSDVCVNLSKCAYKPQIWSLSFMKVNMAECPCKSNSVYNFKCKSGFCAVDEIACDGLLMNKIEKKNSASLTGIKRCA